MIQFFLSKEPTDCCGCRACEQICVHQAISFHEDEEGFLYPIIDNSQCVNCGLCEKVCPMQRSESTFHSQGRAFAFQLSDKAQLLKSSSGGVFYAIASKVISDNGVVYGAAFDNKKVKHKRVDNIYSLAALMGSKYVQSDTSDTYSQVRQDLHNGKKVFYSGTPCQIAGLKLFLRKDFDNLLTADLVCHGTPSPKILEETISHIEERLIAKVERYSFRDKRVGGWSCSSSSSSYIHGKKHIFLKHSKEMTAYYKAFHSGHLMRMNCYRCPFARLERTGDITIADYWGVKKYHPEFPNISKGVSLFICNSEKGINMLQSLSSSYIKEVDLKQAANCNRNLLMPTPYVEDRKTSYKLFCDNYDNFIKKYYQGYYWINNLKAKVFFLIRTNEWLFILVSKLAHIIKK